MGDWGRGEITKVKKKLKKITKGNLDQCSPLQKTKTKPKFSTESAREFGA
jgi:hypothetical protein